MNTRILAMDAKIVVFFTIIGAALAGLPRHKGKVISFYFYDNIAFVA